MSPRKAAVLRDGGGDQSLREHLIATAERLVARQGTAGLTVRDIAREAGVAIGVLYNHFTDKEELLALGLHAHVRTVEHRLGEPPGRAGGGTVEANLRAYVRHGLELHTAIVPAFAGLSSQPKVLARFTELPNPLADGRGLHAVLADYLRAEQRLGRVAAGAGVDTTATMIVGACHEATLPAPFHIPVADPPPVPPGFTDELIAVILHGLTPAPLS